MHGIERVIVDGEKLHLLGGSVTERLSPVRAPDIVDLVDDDEVLRGFGICKHQGAVDSHGGTFTRFVVEHSLPAVRPVARDRVITAGIDQVFPRMSDPGIAWS